MKRFMIFNAKKFNIMLSLLLVTTLSLGINNKAEILPISNQAGERCKKIYFYSTNHSKNKFAKTGTQLV